MADPVQNAETLQSPEIDDPFGWVGHVLEGKYAIEALIGEGGFAVVYRAHHKGLDDRIAVKCLKIPKKLAGEERDRFLQSFLDEGKLLHRLSRADAGIVQALDVGAVTSPNGTWTPFLVLEWLDGRTLEDDLRARARGGIAPRTLAEAILLLTPAARALETAHAQGVAHRDVKPANLFLANVAGKRVLKVVDFGIAKVIGESVDLQRAHEATGLSLHAFTPRYGAPEQFDRRFGATGPWTDVFALGLILVEMVLGRSAMAGDAAQLFVAASNVQHRPTLRAFGVDEGDEVERVLARALAVDPKERYASAGKLWDELLRVTASAATVLSTSAPPTLPDAALPTAPTALDAPPVPARRPVVSLRDTLAEPPAERGGARWLWPVLGVCAISAAGAIYAFALHPSDGDEVRGPQATPTATEPSSAAAPDPGADATVAEPAEAVPAVTPVLCAQGLAPYVNAELGYSLCIPRELAGKEPQDGVLRAGELALTLEAGRLRPPDVTLDRMFARDAKSSLEDDDRWILDSETKKTDTWYFLTGKRHGKPFAKRVVITTDRFAGFEIAYPPSQRQAVESKLEHMVPTFAATTGAP